MSIAYVVLKLEREGQSDPPPVLPFSKKPTLGRVKTHAPSMVISVFTRIKEATQYRSQLLYVLLHNVIRIFKAL